jgi:glycerophosphoryl diester phosphodiesterase
MEVTVHRPPLLRLLAAASVPVLAGIVAVPYVATAAPAAPAAPAVPTSIQRSHVAPPGSGHETLVIGHRGASGYRPEHTLASYELAARMGADFIEPDLVSTKDHVLVVRHENDITGTTDVADHAEFAKRKRTKTVDGQVITGWFTEDFTLRELKTLRAKERLPQVRQHNTLYDGRFQIPTLQEVLDLRTRLSKELHRTIGVYPETKHPTYFDSIGLSLEEPLLKTLRRNGLDHATSPVYVQSFETSNLRDLRRLGLLTAEVQLTGATGAPYDLVSRGDSRTYADLTTPAGLRWIARYADGIGPDKNQVIPRTADDRLGTPTALVRNAHRAGLVVHPYTFRAENVFLPADFRIGIDPTAYGRAIDEQLAFLRTGIDGLFTDQADIGVVARSEFEASAAGSSARKAS